MRSEWSCSAQPLAQTWTFLRSFASRIDDDTAATRLVMELSHCRMLKLGGILESLWPISLLWLREEEGCSTSHSWLTAEPESALELSPALFPLCQEERNVFGSWDHSPGLLLLSCSVMLSHLICTSPECGRL